MEIKCYRDLLVWQKAMDLVIQCYELTEHFPKNELYGLASQIQRAVVSVSANIAEGHGRDHLGDYLHHLSIAAGSLMELETHLLIAQRLNFLAAGTVDKVLQQTDEISRRLTGLKKSLKGKPSPQKP
jgi:four helix bundle protein